MTKKNNKQRLVVDAGRANRLFRTPPCTLLGSAGTWGRLEADRDQTMLVAQEDVKITSTGWPLTESWEYFSLPEIDPEILRKVHGSVPEPLAELLDQYDAPVFPCMALLPMGFSRAFNLAHHAHIHIAQLAVPGAGIIRDRTPAPLLYGGGTGMLIYADNNNHVGVCREQVQQDQDATIEALHARGLDTHDVTEANSLAESLGVRIDGLGGRVQPTPKRD